MLGLVWYSFNPNGPALARLQRFLSNQQMKLESLHLQPNWANVGCVLGQFWQEFWYTIGWKTLVEPIGPMWGVCLAGYKNLVGTRYLKAMLDACWATLVCVGEGHSMVYTVGTWWLWRSCFGQPLTWTLNPPPEHNKSPTSRQPETNVQTASNFLSHYAP